MAVGDGKSRCGAGLLNNFLLISPARGGGPIKAAATSFRRICRQPSRCQEGCGLLESLARLPALNRRAADALAQRKDEFPSPRAFVAGPKLRGLGIVHNGTSFSLHAADPCLSYCPVPILARACPRRTHVLHVPVISGGLNVCEIPAIFGHASCRRCCRRHAGWRGASGPSGRFSPTCGSADRV